jgi:hypothetical protein
MNDTLHIEPRWRPYAKTGVLVLLAIAVQL